MVIVYLFSTSWIIFKSKCDLWIGLQMTDVVCVIPCMYIKGLSGRWYIKYRIYRSRHCIGMLVKYSNNFTMKRNLVGKTFHLRPMGLGFESWRGKWRIPRILVVFIGSSLFIREGKEKSTQTTYYYRRGLVCFVGIDKNWNYFRENDSEKFKKNDFLIVPSRDF